MDILEKLVKYLEFDSEVVSQKLNVCDATCGMKTAMWKYATGSCFAALLLMLISYNLLIKNIRVKLVTKIKEKNDTNDDFMCTRDAVHAHEKERALLNEKIREQQSELNVLRREKAASWHAI